MKKTFKTIELKGFTVDHSLFKHEDYSVTHMYSIASYSGPANKCKLMKYVERRVNALYNLYNSVKVDSYNDCMYRIVCK